MTQRRRILMVQPSIQPDGGGNAVAAWMLQALRSTHALGLMTWEAVDLEAVNRFFGTSLASSDVTLEPVPRWFRALDRAPFGIALLKRALLIRASAPIAARYDMVVTANNEMAFARPGLQYVHYPAQTVRRPDEDRRWWHGPSAVLAAYYAAANRIAGFSADAMRRNVTLVNSRWTGCLFESIHEAPARVVYPPVSGPFANVPWSERENGFLCIGRIAPEKNLDRVIDIVRALRDRGEAVSLCLVGTPGRRAYYEHIRSRVAGAGDWLTLRENLSRRELLDLMPRYRYGLHGRDEEHFGMAPAEMAAAGCIVFVPDSGGQTEIVEHPDLVYRAEDDAVRRIARVLADPGWQRTLRDHLAARTERLSAERFCVEVQAIAEDVLREPA